MVINEVRLRHRRRLIFHEAWIGNALATEQCDQMGVLKILPIGSAAITQQRFAQPRTIF
jgi:hypothetical protein